MSTNRTLSAQVPVRLRTNNDGSSSQLHTLLTIFKSYKFRKNRYHLYVAIGVSSQIHSKFVKYVCNVCNFPNPAPILACSCTDKGVHICSICAFHRIHQTITGGNYGNS